MVIVNASDGDSNSNSTANLSAKILDFRGFDSSNLNL